jgi:flavodoxin
MKTSIIYFTRTGKTEAIAKELATKLNTTAFQVTDDKNWKGIFGFIKGGLYASTNREVNIQFNEKAFEADHLIILSPLWAGGPAPAIRTLLKRYDHDAVSVVFTCIGSNVERAYITTENLFPNIKNFFGITKKLKNQDAVIKQIVDSQ